MYLYAYKIIRLISLLYYISGFRYYNKALISFADFPYLDLNRREKWI